LKGETTALHVSTGHGVQRHNI